MATWGSAGTTAYIESDRVVVAIDQSPKPHQGNNALKITSSLCVCTFFSLKVKTPNKCKR